MNGKSRDALAPRPAETRFLAKLLERPERLRERLVLAIVLAPPQGRRLLRAWKRRR